MKSGLFASGIIAALLVTTSPALAEPGTEADVRSVEQGSEGGEVSAENHSPFRKKPQFVIEEYQLVVPGKEDFIVDYYYKWVEPVLKKYPGYLGMAVVSQSPQGLVEDPKLAKYVGIPADPISPHVGVVLDGEIRTDRQINFHTGVKGAFNIVFHHYIEDEETLRKIMDGHESRENTGSSESFPTKWREMYGTNVWDVLAKEYFVHLRNHYDVIYVYKRAN